MPILDNQVSRTPAAIIDGKRFSLSLLHEIKTTVESLRVTTGRVPGLAVILVGEDPASQVYVAAKKRNTLGVGMRSFEHRLPADVSKSNLIGLIHNLNCDPLVHGIPVQLPLPPHLDSSSVIQAIDPEKDVDGFHSSNVGKLATGNPSIIPCTPLGCLMLLKETLGEELAGLNAVVIGKSNVVGRPMAQLLMHENCTVTVAHIRTRNLDQLCKTADILVVAAGKPGLVRGEWVRPGATVIDVGINRILTEGRAKIVGDVAYSEVSHARAVTPVPGGVGPMTIACLLSNTLAAFRKSLSHPAIGEINRTSDSKAC